MGIELNTPWMTVEEAAEYARVGQDTIIRWINEGRISPVVSRKKKNLAGPGNPGYVIDRADLDGAMQAMKRNIAREIAGEPEPAKPAKPAKAIEPGGIEAFRRNIRTRRN